MVTSPLGRPTGVVQQLHGALLGVMNVLRAHLEHEAAAFDLTAAQAITLFHLGRSGSMPMRELAAQQQCDPSNITGMADRLEARGLLERHADPEDRRVKMLTLTDAGEDVRAQLGERVSSLVPGLSELDETEAQQLLQLLLRVLHEAGAAPVHSAQLVGLMDGVDGANGA